MPIDWIWTNFENRFRQTTSEASSAFSFSLPERWAKTKQKMTKSQGVAEFLLVAIMRVVIRRVVTESQKVAQHMLNWYKVAVVETKLPSKIFTNSFIFIDIRLGCKGCIYIISQLTIYLGYMRFWLATSLLYIRLRLVLSKIGKNTRKFNESQSVYFNMRARLLRARYLYIRYLILNFYVI